MKLKPGFVAAYKRRHDAIWPELPAPSRISDCSSSLDEASPILFALQNQSDDHTAADLPNHPIVKKRWACMSPLMEVSSDHLPACSELKQVFHLE